MRIAVALIALLFATGAAAEQPLLPDSRMLLPDQSSLPGAAQGRVPCRDTIHEVREARGLPQLDSGDAAPEPPQLIAAVDHRINGCAVMVMYDNTSDVRPLPAIPDGPPRLQRVPAR